MRNKVLTTIVPIMLIIYICSMTINAAGSTLSYTDEDGNTVNYTFQSHGKLVMDANGDGTNEIEIFPEDFNYYPTFLPPFINRSIAVRDASQEPYERSVTLFNNSKTLLERSQVFAPHLNTLDSTLDGWVTTIAAEMTSITNTSNTAINTWIPYVTEEMEEITETAYSAADSWTTEVAGELATVKTGAYAKVDTWTDSTTEELATITNGADAKIDTWEPYIDGEIVTIKSDATSDLNVIKDDTEIALEAARARKDEILASITMP